VYDDFLRVQNDLHVSQRSWLLFGRSSGPAMHQPRPLRRLHCQHVQHDGVVHDQHDLHVGDRSRVLFRRSSGQTMHQPRPLRREYRRHVQHDDFLRVQNDLHVSHRSRVLFRRSSGQRLCCSGGFFHQNLRQYWCKWHSNRHLQHRVLPIWHGGFEFGVFGMHQSSKLCGQYPQHMCHGTCS
jgi:hypothetical protein